MSVKKPDVWYEFTRDIKPLGGDALDVRVRFFYKNGNDTITKRFNFTMHAENETELEQHLDSAWEQYKPNPSVDAMVDKLRGKNKIE